MKIIDEENDYFLHDFDNDPPRPAPGEGESQPKQQPAPDTGRADAPADFSFTDPEPNGTDAADSPGQKPTRKSHTTRICLVLILLAVLGVAFYIRYCNPYIAESKTTGFIVNVEKRGIFFKTFEGEMVSESQLTDTSRVYRREIFFSAPDDSLGRVAQSYQGTGRRVIITTQQYYGTLPWRGASKTVLTDIRPY